MDIAGFDSSSRTTTMIDIEQSRTLMRRNEIIPTILTNKFPNLGSSFFKITLITRSDVILRSQSANNIVQDVSSPIRKAL